MNVERNIRTGGALFCACRYCAKSSSKSGKSSTGIPKACKIVAACKNSRHSSPPCWCWSCEHLSNISFLLLSRIFLHCATTRFLEGLPFGQMVSFMLASKNANPCMKTRLFCGNAFAFVNNPCVSTATTSTCLSFLLCPTASSWSPVRYVKKSRSSLEHVAKRSSVIATITDS